MVIVPGVSAVQAAAAVLGAPLMHDFAVISLSDLLTPWDLIEQAPGSSRRGRFRDRSSYNPRSKGRVTPHQEARQHHARLPFCRRPRSASSATPAAMVRKRL